MFLHMDTDGVRAMMRGFADTARDLDSGWQAVLGAITGGESAFGGDAVGAAIGSAYRPAGEALRELAARVPAGMLADAEVGELCADDYVAADRRASAMLPDAGS